MHQAHLFQVCSGLDFKKRTASPPPKEEVGKGGPSPKVGSKTLGASGPHFFRHSDASDGETHTAYEDVDDDCDMEGKPPSRPKLPFSAKQQEDLLVEAKKNMEALEKIGLLGGESLQTMQNQIQQKMLDTEQKKQEEIPLGVRLRNKDRALGRLVSRLEKNNQRQGQLTLQLENLQKALLETEIRTKELEQKVHKVESQKRELAAEVAGLGPTLVGGGAKSDAGTEQWALLKNVLEGDLDPEAAQLRALLDIYIARASVKGCQAGLGMEQRSAARSGNTTPLATDQRARSRTPNATRTTAAASAAAAHAAAIDSDGFTQGGDHDGF